MRWRRVALVAIAILCTLIAAVWIFLAQSRFEMPPRPQPSANLLDDKALARTGYLPAVRSDWRADVQSRHHAIRSLFSDDFADLQFLKPLLAGKRLVQLGESSHGIAEYSWMKTRLIKFLHREMGFDLLAFESNLTGAYVIDAQIGSSTPDQIMRGSIFATWWTEEVRPLFEYLQQVRSSDKPLTLAGFDNQNSGASRQEITRIFRTLLTAVDTEAVPKLDVHEERLAKFYSGTEGTFSTVTATETIAFYRGLADIFGKNRKALKALPGIGPKVVDFAIQEATGRAAFTESLASGATNPRLANELRDKAMADNIAFLLDTAYPERKMIVWAHNAHIGVGYPTREQYKSMGSWLAEKRRPEMYMIGLFMGYGGQSSWQTRPRVDRFYALTENSLETVMASAGRQMSFVDFSQATAGAGREWMFEPIKSREWGVEDRLFVPRSVFDAVIYIDAVTAPLYLN